MNPRGEPTWPNWRDAEPGITRVRSVRSGRRGTFLRWPRIAPGRKSPGYAVIEWDSMPGVELHGTWNRRARVVAYAYDLEVVA